LDIGNPICQNWNNQLSKNAYILQFIIVNKESI